MEIHEKNINLSIDTNIIGTCNIVKVCKKSIYLSTNYVYPGLKGGYKENFIIITMLGLKLGGEFAVQMYDNSLILRVHD